MILAVVAVVAGEYEAACERVEIVDDASDPLAGHDLASSTFNSSIPYSASRSRMNLIIRSWISSPICSSGFLRRNEIRHV